MSEFTALRARARDKRDRAVSDARKEYEETLTAIAALEHGLTGRKRSLRKISACIESVIPRAEPFNSTEIIASLEALDPSRVWHKWTVDNHITKLRAKGIIRRLRRHKGNERALYVRVGAEVDRLPFEDMTLSAVIRQVLVRPMNVTELAVKILEAGYHTTMTDRTFRNVVGEVLRAKGNGFHRDGSGKWTKAKG